MKLKTYYPIVSCSLETMSTCTNATQNLRLTY